MSLQAYYKDLLRGSAEQTGDGRRLLSVSLSQLQRTRDRIVLLSVPAGSTVNIDQEQQKHSLSSDGEAQQADDFSEERLLLHSALSRMKKRMDALDYEECIEPLRRYLPPTATVSGTSFSTQLSAQTRSLQRDDRASSHVSTGSSTYSRNPEALERRPVTVYETIVPAVCKSATIICSAAPVRKSPSLPTAARHEDSQSNLRGWTHEQWPLSPASGSRRADPVAGTKHGDRRSGRPTTSTAVGTGSHAREQGSVSIGDGVDVESVDISDKADEDLMDDALEAEFDYASDLLAAAPDRRVGDSCRFFADRTYQAPTDGNNSTNNNNNNSSSILLSRAPRPPSRQRPPPEALDLDHHAKLTVSGGAVPSTMTSRMGHRENSRTTGSRNGAVDFRGIPQKQQHRMATNRSNGRLEHEFAGERGGHAARDKRDRPFSAVASSSGAVAGRSGASRPRTALARKTSFSRSGDSASSASGRNVLLQQQSQPRPMRRQADALMSAMEMKKKNKKQKKSAVKKAGKKPTTSGKAVEREGPMGRSSLPVQKRNRQWKRRPDLVSQETALLSAWSSGNMEAIDQHLSSLDDEFPLPASLASDRRRGRDRHPVEDVPQQRRGHLTLATAEEPDPFVRPATRRQVRHPASHGNSNKSNFNSDEEDYDIGLLDDRSGKAGLVGNGFGRNRVAPCARRDAGGDNAAVGVDNDSDGDGWHGVDGDNVQADDDVQEIDEADDEPLFSGEVGRVRMLDGGGGGASWPAEKQSGDGDDDDAGDDGDDRERLTASDVSSEDANRPESVVQSSAHHPRWRPNDGSAEDDESNVDDMDDLMNGIYEDRQVIERIRRQANEILERLSSIQLLDTLNV